MTVLRLHLLSWIPKHFSRIGLVSVYVSQQKVKYEIWVLYANCGPHEATRCQSLGAPSTVHSQLVPEIINMCFSIKASSIHCNTLTKNRLKHFHLNRYTLFSYICRILQARRSHWHLTYYYGQMLSDFFFYVCVCYRPESFSIEIHDCFFNVILKLSQPAH